MIDISFRAIFPFEQELRAAQVSSVAGSTHLLRSIFLSSQFYERHARFIENISGGLIENISGGFIENISGGFIENISGGFIENISG